MSKSVDWKATAMEYAEQLQAMTRERDEARADAKRAWTAAYDYERERDNARKLGEEYHGRMLHSMKERDDARIAGNRLLAILKGALAQLENAGGNVDADWREINILMEELERARNA